MALPSSNGKAPNVFISVDGASGSAPPKEGNIFPGPKIVSFPPVFTLVVQPRWSNGEYFDLRTYSNNSSQDVILNDPPYPSLPPP